jgi:hypothetical protein
MLMSALPPKADMCGALAHVCFGPIADIARHSILVGTRNQRRRDRQAEHLRGFEIDDHLELVGLLDREVGRLCSFMDFV